jgi:hypothetical protein
MTEPVIRATAELRYFSSSDEWEASAYGGGDAANGVPPIQVRLRRDTEDEAKAAFREEWNERQGTEWADDQFAWEYNQVDGERAEGGGV